ncbi:MAG: hypothetical protein AABW67_06335 [Nanoarchaeota archaeon]
MDTQKQFQTYENPELIGKGLDGFVYRISENHVAKIDEDVTFIDSLKHQYDICKKLYEKSISVPKPEGVFQIQIKGIPIPAFIMQFIEGFNIKKIKDSPDLMKQLKLSADDVNRICYLHTAEVIKAERLGFHPTDGGYNNGIWSPSENKNYLIDFSYWKETN